MTGAPTDATTLELREVTLGLGARRLLGPISLRVPAGQVVTVMGPSGCGKSSLLGFVCGTLDPAFAAGGAVLLDGRDITALPPERRRIGILFQDDLLFPHLSVAENLAFGLPPAVRGRAARRERILRALSEADLDGFADRDPATLSGGQRARIALLRTLLAAPRALLLDEPFSKLDARLRDRFRRFVFDHARRNALPALLVTHDPADAAAAAGPVMEIGARESDEVPAESQAEARDSGPKRSAKAYPSGSRGRLDKPAGAS